MDNRKGTDFLKRINDFNLNILNGDIEGDWEREFTQTYYKSQSVIDYVVVNGDARKDIETVRFGSQMKSDHLPLETTLRKHFVEPPITLKTMQRYTATNIDKDRDRLRNYRNIKNPS